MGLDRTRTLGGSSLGDGLAAKVERTAAMVGSQGRSLVDLSLSRPAVLQYADSFTGVANGGSFSLDLPEDHLWSVVVQVVWDGVDAEFDYGTSSGSFVIPDGTPNPPFMWANVSCSDADIEDHRIVGRAYGVSAALRYKLPGEATGSIAGTCNAYPPPGWTEPITFDVSVFARWRRRLVNGA